jgi:hypothetical protein
MTLRSTIALAAGVLVLGAPLASRAQLTAGEVQQILALHDTERCMVDPPAAMMPALAWDDLLAIVGQSYAATCNLGVHNANRQADYAALGGSGSVGENIAWGSLGYTPLELAQLWADEKSLWTYDVLTSTNFNGVGHYTQMIWANTTAVGCGLAKCATAQGDVSFLVCDYAPAGNVLGQPPYVAGSGVNQACPEPLGSLAAAGALAAIGALRGLRRR